MKKVCNHRKVKGILLFSFFIFHFSFSYAQHFVFYGLTSSGGVNNDGLIYRYDPISSNYDTLVSLDMTTGAHTWAGLCLASNGLFYGVTEDGGSENFGTMFSYNRISNKLSVLINFDSTHTGEYATGGNCVMQARNGLLYGTEVAGGRKDSGVFYSYNILTGKDSVLFSFDSIEGTSPLRTVIADTSTGFLYGTTFHGGTKDFGVIYRYDPITNKDTVVYNFDSAGENGVLPEGTLLMANNGLFYGMTTYGGSPLFNGTLYSFNPKTFKETTLISFTGPNGNNPAYGNLMQTNDSLLYGMTITGGSNNDGVLFNFNINTNKQTVLFSFDGANGNEPIGDLVEDPDNGKLYGVAGVGGAHNLGVIFCYNPITGKDSVVYNFNGTDGSYPVREPTLVRDTPTVINEVSARSGGVKVYPNPNNGIFQLLIMNYELGIKHQVEVYSTLGERIYEATLNSASTQIDLNDEPTGVYLCRIISETGDLVSEGKFVIEK